MSHIPSSELHVMSDTEEPKALGIEKQHFNLEETFYSALELPSFELEKLSCMDKLNNVCIPKTGFVFTNVFIMCAIWGAMVTVTQNDSLPGGNLFGLLVVFICSVLIGLLISHLPCIKLPGLLGMLVAGILLTNIDAINVAHYINRNWSVALRNTALVVILLHSGLELDPVALKKLKCTVIRLAFGPCIIEALSVTIVAYFLLDLPWLWGLQLG